jgi:hypothetical protein
MESMLYQGHGFLGGIKHFWMAVRVWKTNLILEDLAQKCDQSEGSREVWSTFDSQNDQDIQNYSEMLMLYLTFTGRKLHLL